MKKISMLFSLPLISSAAVLYSEAIKLTPGWNIISTPRILESHSFSLPETSDNFDIFVLNASSTSGWSTFSDVGQTEFTPLYGYFVNNKNVAAQTLTFNYKDTSATPNARIFERTFSRTGWYSFGIANATYAKKTSDDATDSNNPGNVLHSLSTGYDSVIDLTDEFYAQALNRHAVGNTWKQAVASDINSLNDFRDTKGYVVYMNSANTLYSGFQNNNVSTPFVAGSVSFARTSGFTATTTSPSISAVKIGSFTIQVGAGENIIIDSVGVNPNVSGYAVTNITNLTLKEGSTVLGTPVGNPSASTSTFTLSNYVISPSTSKTFDVYADIGSASTGSTTASMSVTYHGLISDVSEVASASGVAVTSIVSVLADATLIGSSPVSQYVVGGSTFGIATYRLSTVQAGTTATVRELRFTTTGTDAIESITVSGVTAAVVGSGPGATTTVTGFSIAVGSTGSDVPVTIKYAGFLNSTSGGTLTQSIPSTSITLGYIEATSGSGSVITNSTAVASNAMILVASKPTITVASGSGSAAITLGAENKVGEFTVTADANGKISIASTSLDVSSVGITASEFTGYRLADGGTTIPTATLETAGNSSTTPVFTFSPAYEISAGQSKTFSVYATVNGVAQNGIVPYASSTLTSPATFKWNDFVGGNTAQNGSMMYNFPVSSFVTTH